MLTLAWPSLLFGAALLVAAATVIALYRLRPPPRSLTVASLLLWRSALRRAQQRRAWRRLISLLLSILLVALVVSALAGLALGGSTASLEVIVVDTGPTLATLRADGASRLDQAKREARRLVANARAPVLLADTTGQLALPPTDDHRRLYAALDALRPGRERPSLPLTTIRAWQERAQRDTQQPLTLRTTLITDGVGMPRPEGVDLISVFEPAANLGIVSFAIDQPLGHSPEAFAAVANAGDAPVDAELEVRDALGSVLANQPLRLAPGERWSGVLTLGAAQSPVRATLRATPAADGTAPTRHDARSEDDTALAAMAMSDLSAGAEVALLGRPGDALRRALASLPGLRITSLSAAVPTPATLAGFDLVIHAGATPSEPPPYRALLLDPEPRPWLPELPAASERRLGQLLSWSAPYPDPREARRAGAAENERLEAPMPLLVWPLLATARESVATVRLTGVVALGRAARDGVVTNGVVTNGVVTSRPEGVSQQTLPLLFSPAAHPTTLVAPFALAEAPAVEREGYPLLVASLVRAALATPAGNELSDEPSIDLADARRWEGAALVNDQLVSAEVIGDSSVNDNRESASGVKQPSVRGGARLGAGTLRRLLLLVASGIVLFELWARRRGVLE